MNYTKTWQINTVCTEICKNNSCPKMQHPNPNLWLATGGKRDLFFSSENATDQSTRTKSLDTCCLATGYKRSHGKRILCIFSPIYCCCYIIFFWTFMAFPMCSSLWLKSLLASLWGVQHLKKGCYLPKWWAMFPALLQQPTPHMPIYLLQDCAPRMHFMAGDVKLKGSPCESVIFGSAF